MKFIACHLTVGGALQWQDLGPMGGAYAEDGITISFPIFHRVTIREAGKIIAEALAKNSVEWLRFESGGWLFRSKKFKDFFSRYENESWLSGDFELEMDHDIRRVTVFDREEDRTYVKFVITPEIVREKWKEKFF
ncbi:hypothetical protein KTD19_26985 [Burkholderia multivorans]|uniref:hypothetical protein n=1 Tax=Burkholderia multivorans TaxID=87883 RepID=UPI0012DFCF3F|nr:hypothetical protein [Burkholderia multivorans]MBU9236030.1 hypothetical protein [Burkholderia multivorans]QGR94646.1 hypothetical protein FOC30_27780 [Burkholderia multivorans]HEF4739515.1 hypothetical protein [Burkholderia multivorans]